MVILSAVCILGLWINCRSFVSPHLAWCHCSRRLCTDAACQSSLHVPCSAPAVAAHTNHAGRQLAAADRVQGLLRDSGHQGWVALVTRTCCVGPAPAAYLLVPRCACPVCCGLPALLCAVPNQPS